LTPRPTATWSRLARRRCITYCTLQTNQLSIDVKPAGGGAVCLSAFGEHVRLARSIDRPFRRVGDPLHDRSYLLRRGYMRVADPDSAAAGWVPAFAIDWALEKLGWKNPATPAQRRRCLDVIARYVYRRAPGGEHVAHP
jgi:hypothetical protein